MSEIGVSRMRASRWRISGTLDSPRRIQFKRRGTPDSFRSVWQHRYDPARLGATAQTAERGRPRPSCTTTCDGAKRATTVPRNGQDRAPPCRAGSTPRLSSATRRTREFSQAPASLGKYEVVGPLVRLGPVAADQHPTLEAFVRRPDQREPSPVIEPEPLGSFACRMRAPGAGVQFVGAFRRPGLTQSLGGDTRRSI